MGREFLVALTRGALAELREEISPVGKHVPQTSTVEFEPAAVEQRIAEEAERLLAGSLQTVINATGVVLHTNLGRAPLAMGAVERIRQAATRYSNLEYDLKAGTRGTRDVHTSQLIALLCGAESAIVVNNNAAAVYLVLAALARGGEAIVSRGELIEIGDGFRIPEIMAQSGTILCEVGTTNRTKLSDYERAINKNTRIILRVHRSNFKMVGFSAQPELKDLCALGRRKKIPVYEDLGSGCLADLREHGVAEPVVKESFAAGADIVSFSGDKLLGGPQAGIIAGRRELIAKIRRHPMFRALRVDKMTIMALDFVLLNYIVGALDEVPILRMIRASATEIGERANRLAAELSRRIPATIAKFEVRNANSVIGGGSTPGQSLPTRAIVIKVANLSANGVESRLRRPKSGTPVITRVEKNLVWLDLRTVFPDQEATLADALVAALVI
jgi:L-seryl-tRNA(Ser) seleniumtransferase